MDGREERFEQVVAEMADPLHRFLVRRLPADEVDDVLADTMLVLWRRLDEVPAGAVLPWSYGVARHCLANAARSARRRGRLDARLRASQSRTETVPDPAADAVAQGAADRVHAALAQLTDDQRELVRLWAWEQLGPAEIAVVLGISPNAASVRLHRARSRIAKILEHAERSGAHPDMDG